jgi:hypothetical protein
MNVLERFESAMQGIVEGSFGRLFRSRLHPVELARKLERAMEEHLALAPGRRIAPNVYEVYLSPRDSQQFSSYTRTLTQQMQDSLIEVARRRGYMLTSRPLVIFHIDERLITGEVRIDARLAEPQTVANLAAGLAEETGEPVEGTEGIDATRALSPNEQQQLAQEVDQARVAQAALPQAWLTLRRPDGGGQVYRLDRPIIHIGRHVTNEIVVNDRRVSRYHAEIRFERGEFVLYDLGSLNGVAVNGKIVRQPVALHNNDQVAIGSHDFIFQRR